MKRLSVIFLLFCTTIISSVNAEENQKNKNYDEDITEQFLPMISTILQTGDYTNFKENISPEAYVINGNSYESIFEILSNSSKKEKFVEGKDSEIGLMHLLISDSQENAYLVLETKSKDRTKSNWHSIYFKIDGNKWKLLSWHKS